MADRLIEVGEGFWNIRGTFRIGGVVQIGTQASLVRLGDGRFVLLDSYTLPDAILGQVRDLTDGGKDIDAIINVHPFHTIHVAAAHQQFPAARLFGTARHVQQASALTWQDVQVEDPEMAEVFAGDLELSIPEGVDFISADPKIHFASALVYHRASQTIHVDDTFNHLAVPLLGGLRVHPALKQALKKEPGAARAFAGWGSELITRWAGARHLCAAHTSALLNQDDLAAQLRQALARSDSVLRAHERAYG